MTLDSRTLDGMTPEKRREALSTYLDGELSAADSRVVAAWLAVHPDARDELERTRRVSDLLGAYADEPVPEGFAARVLDGVGARPIGNLATQPSARLLRLPIFRPIAAAAVLLLALGISLLVWRGKPPAGGRETSVALEAVPADLLEHADVLLSLSDSEFDAVLDVDPDELADPSPVNGARGG